MIVLSLALKLLWLIIVNTFQPQGQSWSLLLRCLAMLAADGEDDKNSVEGDSSGGASASSEARELNSMGATGEPLAKKSKT